MDYQKKLDIVKELVKPLATYKIDDIYNILENNSEILKVNIKIIIW